MLIYYFYSLEIISFFKIVLNRLYRSTLKTGSLILGYHSVVQTDDVGHFLEH